MKILCETKGMSREEWLKQRKNGIGGSDAPAVCGVSRWASPLSVYLDKISDDIDNEETEYMKWGTRLEDDVLEEFRERHPEYTVQRRNAILQSDKHPFMICNLDGYIKHNGKTGVLEIKTTNAFRRNEWGDNEAPEDNEIQAVHNMYVAGADFAWLAVLIGGNHYEDVYIERDDKLIENLIKIESEFWQKVLDRTPPDIDGSSASTDILNSLYPHANNEAVELPKDAIVLIQQADAVRAQISELKEKQAYYDNQLKEILGDNALGHIEDDYSEYKVSWKEYEARKFDTKVFKKDHAKLYEKYSTPSTSRRFTIKTIDKSADQIRKGA